LCFLPAERANRVYFLHAGAVAEFRPARDGRAGLVAFINPGMLFGLQGLRYGLYDRSAEYKMECRALVDAEYCEIPSGRVAEGLRSEPRIAETVTRSLLLRIQDNQLLLAFAPDGDTERRMIALVWMLATRMGVARDGALTVNGFSHAALAELMSATRPTVTRVLARLEARGLVTVGRRELRIPDPDRLIELLD
jgi:CRP-like cAMP-binding protein